MKYTLITGSANGLGKEFAKLYARDNNNLLLVDVGEKALSEVKEELFKECPNIEVKTLVCDLSLKEELYKVKKYVADIIGEEYIIPTLNVWNSFDEIDFDTLPDQFVLKCTHDSGGLVICNDKTNFDKEAAKKKIEASMKAKYYYHGREWSYKNVKPRIIAEEYMEDATTKDLRDYKFFAFNGDVKMLFIATERQEKDSETKFDFFDENFEHLPVTNGHPNSEPPYFKPENFDKMKELAEILSKDIPHVRVDFYNVNGKIYFGELTFYHWSGLIPFSPEEWDYKFGEWITLPDKK